MLFNEVFTREMYKKLRQGDKIRFKWYGSDRIYTGRVEIDKFGLKYWCNEVNYIGDEINPVFEGMRYYNNLESFFQFTSFEILK